MKFIICLDTSSNKNRIRANKIFLKYGERVQYSVFEFNLNDIDLLRMKNEIISNVDLKNYNTQLNIYYLPEDYIRKIERIGADNFEPVSDKGISYFT